MLMLAAARDDPDYLRSVDYIHLTERHRRILRKIVAVAADHPDPMYDPALNPDVDRYGITRTPTMIVTGTRDVSPLGEPVGSAWGNFVGLDGLEDRVFLNVAGVTHAQPVVSHGEARYIAYFSRFHVLGDESAGRMVYGEADGSLFDLWKRGEFVAGVGGRNNGGGGKEVGFLACGGMGENVPGQLGKYCGLGLIRSGVERQRINISGEKEDRNFSILIAILLLISFIAVCLYIQSSPGADVVNHELSEMQTLAPEKTK